MKTIKLFDKELTFYNEELYKAVKLAQQMGYKTHTFNPSGNYIRQVFIDNGKTFGSVSEHYSGVSYSTDHKSERCSGFGTGFGLTEDIDMASEEGLNSVFMFAPRWAKGDLSKIKKQSWDEYLSDPMGRILTYAEIETLS